MKLTAEESGNTIGSQLDGEFCIWFPPLHQNTFQNSDSLLAHKQREKVEGVKTQIWKDDG